MSARLLISTIVLGCVSFALSTAIFADKPEGKGGGGKQEETASEIEMYNFGPHNGTEFYALHGDGGDGSGPGDVSVYRDATLDGSTDCALVIATRIDKPSGKAFSWTPHPRMDDECDPLLGMNRWFVIEQPSAHASWSSNPEIDFDGNGNTTIPEVVFARINYSGLYRSVDDVYADGVTVRVAIGQYRINFPTTFNVQIEDRITPDYDGTGLGDIRTVTVGTAPASICAWPTEKTKGKTVCEPVGNGTIVLPLKAKFIRLPSE